MSIGHEGVDPEGNPNGRDPRTMTVKELNALGHFATPLRKLIRKNCLDCVGQSPGEVRICALTSCVFWPYRMSKNPFFGKGEEETDAEV